MRAQRNLAENAATSSPGIRRVLAEMARRRREEAERIGARIAELRERHHLTQAAAALRAPVAYRTWQSWESGEATPRWHNYEKIAKLFGVSVEEILRPGVSEGEDDTTIAETLVRLEAKLDEILALLRGDEGRGLEPPPDPEVLGPDASGPSPSDQDHGQQETG